MLLLCSACLKSLLSTLQDKKKISSAKSFVLYRAPDCKDQGSWCVRGTWNAWIVFKLARASQMHKFSGHNAPACKSEGRDPSNKSLNP